jgi:hypothetical protein
MEHPVGRVDAVLIAEAEGRREGLHRGREALSARFDPPRPEVGILPVVAKRTDTDYLVFIAVDLDAVGIGRYPDEGEPTNDRPLLLHDDPPRRADKATVEPNPGGSGRLALIVMSRGKYSDFERKAWKSTF